MTAPRLPSREPNGLLLASALLTDAIGGLGSPDRSPLCVEHWGEYIDFRLRYLNDNNRTEQTVLLAWLLRKGNKSAVIRDMLPDHGRYPPPYRDPCPTPSSPSEIDDYAAADPALRDALHQRYDRAYRFKIEAAAVRAEFDRRQKERAARALPPLPVV